MNKVISISLNGNAYQLEEAGYELLTQYLQRAEAQLKDDPDRKEILSDLEQAIADKCSNYLRPHKNVVTSEEVSQIIKDMGPVDTGNAEDTATENGQATNQNTASSTDAPKRLYQIRDGAIISGLCKGISVFFNIDVSIVRIAFLFLAFITGGIWALVYLIMMFLIPYANTTEEMAAARGAPFNAQEVIDQAKRNYSELKDKKEWKRHWREQRRVWRNQWQHNMHWWQCNTHHNVNPAIHRGGYAAHIITGLLLPIASIVGVLIFWGWMLAIISLLTTGAIFGWHPPLGNTPTWVLVIIMLMLSGITTAPFKGIRRAAYHFSGHPAMVWLGLWDAIVWIGLSVVI
ncbi:MAG: PspC domain-containing protein, partial [Steroidobacter sp.]